MIFGMPYKGSKNAIAQHIIDMLPPADHFYDLLGGGGAVSHCAALSGKFKYIHYNELNHIVFECFVNSIKGYYQNESRWISRKDFDFRYTSDLLSLRYKEIIQFVKRQKPARMMTELQNFEALRRLQALHGLNVSCTCGSYEDIEIEKNSVIYCDPPYLNTEGYAHKFDYKKFYSWCKKQRNIFISEYTMPDDFLCLGSVKKSVIYDPLNKAQKKQEKLYTNEHHEDRFILC